MKRNDLAKYHQATQAELQLKVTELKRNLKDLQLKKVVQKLKNIKAPKNIKKEIAQLMTIIKAKEMTTVKKETV